MQLIVFTGLPGSGKSTLAEVIGRQLAIPVFDKDWIESPLRRCRLQPAPGGAPTLGWAVIELMTLLAERQLQFGQSGILDSVARTEAIRAQWRTLATDYGAIWQVVECVCPDEAEHRRRIETRQRAIPDWEEIDWAEVERIRQLYEPWQEEHLIVDTTGAFTANRQMILDYLLPSQGSTTLATEST